MAQADATPILWGPLFEGLVLVEGIYGRVVAESDLRGFLRDGRVPWRGDRRGGRESDLASGDRDVWRRESADVDLRIVWKENRLVRTVRARTFPRAGERVFRPAPSHIHFVQIEIDMGRLRALLSIEEPPRDEATSVEETARSRPQRELAETWLPQAYPGFPATSIPKHISATKVERRIRDLGGPSIALSTLTRAMGRKK